MERKVREMSKEKTGTVRKIGVLLRLIHLVRPLSGFMALAVTMGTLGFLTAIFIPVLGGFCILGFLGFETPLPVRTMEILFVVFALLRAFLRFGEQRTNHYIAFTLLALIRDRVFTALRRLCPAKLEGYDKGDLISVITSDVELLEVFYAHTISPICIAFLTELIMCLFIGRYHVLLGLLSLAAYLLVGVALPMFISGRSGSLGEELRKQSGELAATMLENIRGVFVSLQFACGEKRRKEMSEKTALLSERQGELNRLTGTNLALANALVLLADGGMLLACQALYARGEVGFDGVLIPLLALLSSFGPVMALANLGTVLQSTVAAGARVLSILDEEPVTEDITGGLELSFTGAGAERVSFSYGREPVLQDVSLAFPERRITGIIGKSGCGKSTLLKLLMRFWKVQEGEVKVSGENIEKIDTACLRSLESYMTQETQLFQDTIAGNVRIGKLSASQEEIEEACRKASIHDFILSLPKGYETPVGELGETLSGGERQRIGLARAFLHEAPFLLLDEPTSNLDSLNEAIILKSLKEEARDKTIALVSHRRSTMRIADQVIAMEAGRKTEYQGA